MLQKRAEELHRKRENDLVRNLIIQLKRTYMAGNRTPMFKLPFFSKWVPTRVIVSKKPYGAYILRSCSDGDEVWIAYELNDIPPEESEA